MANEVIENQWQGARWTEADIKRGRVTSMGSRASAMLAQASWEPKDDIDEWRLVCVERGIITPKSLTRAEMVEYLNKEGFR